MTKGQQLSHAGSHLVAWGKDTHSSCAPQPISMGSGQHRRETIKPRHGPTGQRHMTC